MVGMLHCARAARAPFRLWPDAEREAYFDDVDAAKQHLRAAYRLRPEFPESAAAMVMASALEPDDETPRQWFDRAVAAELDCDCAYRNLLWALRPDRGGSLQRMYAFAVECMDSARYDTDVPTWYAQGVLMTQPELLDGREAWASPDVAARYEKLTAAAVVASPDTPSTRFLENGRCMTAWAGGRYEDAVRGWKAAGEHLDPGWLATWQVDAETVTADLQAVAAEMEQATPEQQH